MEKLKISELISEIKDYLNRTFNEIDLCFDKNDKLRQFRPDNGGWTIDEILEHIGLTNHFLLILINKGTQKALNSNLDIDQELENYVFHRDKLTEVGLHKSFNWIRPDHMDPKGKLTSTEVRSQIRDQLIQCISCLDKLKNGEGVLYKTMMSVNDLGKIDVYEYIYFLAQHGQRHITQMSKNEFEFGSLPKR